MKSNHFFDAIYGLHLISNRHLMFLHSVKASVYNSFLLLVVESVVFLIQMLNKECLLLPKFGDLY